MQMKNHLVMIISLAVSIILVVGVLIPVIADNSGNGSNEPAYTNVGEYYYKTPVAGETHTIEMTVDDNVMILTYDSQTLTTKTLANEMMLIPLAITIEDDEEFLSCFDYIPYVDGTEWSPYWRMVSSTTGHGIASSDNFDSFVLTTNGNQYEYTSGSYSREGVFGLCIAPSGDFVYADKPTVESTETTIYLCDGSGEFKVKDETDGYLKYDAYAGIGDCTTILDDIADKEIDCDWAIFTEADPTGKWFDFQSTTVTELNTEETEYGIKINGAIATSTWLNGSDSELMETPLTHFIVPTNVGETAGEPSMSPTLSAMLSVIPLIVVVGLIIGTLGYFIRRQ